MNETGVVKTTMSDAERKLRRDLAACYRLIAINGWDDLIATHVSVRIPNEDAFLLNPFGLMFDEITASNLVKVNAKGQKLDNSPYPINAAAYVIHSAIHQARHDIGCAIHLHTNDGVAVSATKEGILPLNQSAMLIREEIAFHEYEGVAIDKAEQERLVADLGNKNLMLLRNHGTLALGRTIGEAFTAMYFFEWACTTQVRTLAMGLEINPVAKEVQDKVSMFTRANIEAASGALVWPAMLRKVERLCPGFDA